MSLTSAQKKRRGNWTESETFFLINIYREKQPKFQKSKRNRLIYDEIQAEFRTNGFIRTSTEISKKLQNLIRRYRDEKLKIGTTGGEPSNWIYFQAVHEVIGFLPSQDSSTMVESLNRSFLFDDNEPVAGSSQMELDEEVGESLNERQNSFTLPATELQEEVIDGAEDSEQVNYDHLYCENTEFSQRARSPSKNRKDKKTRFLEELLSKLDKLQESNEKNNTELVQLMHKSLENDSDIIAIMREQADVLKALLKK